jgi:hypothetical protein
MIFHAFRQKLKKTENRIFIHCFLVCLNGDHISKFDHKLNVMNSIEYLNLRKIASVVFVKLNFGFLKQTTLAIFK